MSPYYNANARLRAERTAESAPKNAMTTTSVLVPTRKGQSAVPCVP